MLVPLPPRARTAATRTALVLNAPASQLSTRLPASVLALPWRPSANSVVQPADPGARLDRKRPRLGGSQAAAIAWLLAIDLAVGIRIRIVAVDGERRAIAGENRGVGAELEKAAGAVVATTDAMANATVFIPAPL